MWWPRFREGKAGGLSFGVVNLLKVVGWVWAGVKPELWF